jgi:uncharacterized protein YwqG
MNNSLDNFDLKNKLIELEKKYQLTNLEDNILNFSKNSINLGVKVDNNIPIGKSKYGGSPDLPANFVWPNWNGLPLSFVSQINLSEVKPFDKDNLLPEHGMLYFFIETRIQMWHGFYSHGSCQTFFYEGDMSQLVRTKPPVELEQKIIQYLNWELKQCSITPGKGLKLPYGYVSKNGGEGTYLLKSGITSLDSDSFSNLREEFDTFQHGDWRECHSMLGYALPWQNPDIQLEAYINYYILNLYKNQNLILEAINHYKNFINDIVINRKLDFNNEFYKLASQTERTIRMELYRNLKENNFIEKSIDWILLFQLQSSNILNITIGDGGAIYFYISPENLKEKKFDQVFAVSQS